MSALPDPRRVVTGHDGNGNAIFVADSKVPVETISKELSFAVLYETHQFPASNNGWDDPLHQRTKDLVNPNGIVLRTVDFQPNCESLMHRTESVDFGIVMHGEIVCRLDNGVEKTFKAGDVCVQRGTIHAWDNRTDQPTRVMFVLAAAQPVTVGDKVLGTEGFKAKDMESGGKSSELPN
ncbi:Cupin domain containing protein [Paramyrothecium foliicola]|nr:Cupin domain containing protein [Paramyrothecium foliicola]